MTTVTIRGCVVATDGLRDGPVAVRNLTTGEVTTGTTAGADGYSLDVPVTAGDALDVTFDGHPVALVTVGAPTEGQVFDVGRPFGDPRGGPFGVVVIDQ